MSSSLKTYQQEIEEAVECIAEFGVDNVAEAVSVFNEEVRRETGVDPHWQDFDLTD